MSASASLFQQLLYYKMARYPNPDDWSEEHSEDRLRELINYLLESLETKKMERFFLPRYDRDLYDSFSESDFESLKDRISETLENLEQCVREICESKRQN